MISYISLLKYRLRNYVANSRRLYRLYKLSPANSHRLILPNTMFVVEGFPRSANSYLFHMLRLSAISQGHIAHHLHSPMQLVDGVESKIPSILAIRAPRDAVLSLVVREPFVSPLLAIRAYIAFHQPLIDFVDGLFVADFEVVQNRPQDILNRLIFRYPTTFQSTCAFSELDLKVRRELENINNSLESGNPRQIALPNKEKERSKLAVPLDAKFEEFEKIAQRLYEEIVRG